MFIKITDTQQFIPSDFFFLLLLRVIESLAKLANLVEYCTSFGIRTDGSGNNHFFAKICFYSIYIYTMTAIIRLD